MNINGWNYDFDSLPDWDVRDWVPYVTDLLFENPQRDTAFLIYSIVEYRMCAYAGKLAIFRNKKKPELFLRVEKSSFSNSEVTFSLDGRFAFVQSSVWDGGWPIFIFDLVAKKFSYFETVTDNICFTVREIEYSTFAIVADEWQMKDEPHGLLRKLHGTRIEMNALKWMPFADIDSFCGKSEKPGLCKRLRRFLWR